MCLGYGDLVRQDDDTDVAENRSDVDQPSQTSQSTGRSIIRVATLPLKATRGSSPGTGRDTQSMAFLRTAVIELLYSGEAISRPSWPIIAL